LSLYIYIYIFIYLYLFLYIFSLKGKKKKKGMDYNADIPFEKKPAPGFYDISEEKNRQLEQGLTNVQLDGKRRSDVNEEKKRKKQKTHKDETEGGQINFVPAKSSQLNKLKQAEQISKRRKLVLPAPQVGENELEEVSLYNLFCC